MALLIIELDKRIGNAQAWRDTFREQIPDLPIRIWPDAGEVKDIEYLAFMHPDFDALPAFPNLKAMFSRAAGVDDIVRHPKLPKVPLGKVEPPGGDPMMTEYVVMHVLRLHRDMPAYQAAQARREWRQGADRPARAKARRFSRLRNDGQGAGADPEVARLPGLGVGSLTAAGRGGADFPWPRSARAVSQSDRYRGLPVAADRGNRGHLLRAHVCHDAERRHAGERRTRQACGGQGSDRRARFGAVVLRRTGRAVARAAAAGKPALAASQSDRDAARGAAADRRPAGHRNGREHPKSRGRGTASGRSRPHAGATDRSARRIRFQEEVA